jgi:hypothetical protein
MHCCFQEGRASRPRPLGPLPPLQFTNDLATPAVAALLHCGAEAYLSSREQLQLDERARGRALRRAEEWRAEREGGRGGGPQ